MSRREQFDAMNTAANTSAPSSRPASQPVLPCEGHWIEIECFDDEGKPMANQDFILKRSSGAELMPGTREIRGQLDAYGYARIVRIEGMDDCVLEFPGLEDELEVAPMYPEFWADVEANRSDGS